MKILNIIVHYHNFKDTEKCLQSIVNIRLTIGMHMQTLIINNGIDGLDRLRKLARAIPVISYQKNLGFAEGNNQGIRWGLAKNFDYFILLNNDTTVDPNLVAELIKVIKDNPDAGIVTPKIYFAPGYEFHRDRYSQKECGKVIWFAGGHIDWQNMLCSHRGVDEVDSGQYDKITETDFATGCCMLIKKEVVRKVGLLDPRYFLYWEDVDFSVRSKKAGYKIFFAPQAVMWHKNAGSSRSGSELHDYYLTRNRLLFGMKYAPLRTKAALIKESWYLIRKGRVGQKAGCRDFLRGHFGER